MYRGSSLTGNIACRVYHVAAPSISFDLPVSTSCPHCFLISTACIRKECAFVLSYAQGSALLKNMIFIQALRICVMCSCGCRRSSNITGVCRHIESSNNAAARWEMCQTRRCAQDGRTSSGLHQLHIIVVARETTHGAQSWLCATHCFRRIKPVTVRNCHLTHSLAISAELILSRCSCRRSSATGQRWQGRPLP